MEKQIDLWLRRGVISAEQAEIMRKDINQSKKLSTQNRFITAISTIGAALLGVGAILFISANWSYMTPILKAIVLSSSTILIYFIGYYLKYVKGNFPVVGSSLLFLSALLLGASLFLVTQMYHFINANAHGLVLIWLLLLLPFVYTIRNYAVSTLVTIIFYIWWWLFLASLESYMGGIGDRSLYKALLLFFLPMPMLISFGTLHGAYQAFTNVGKAMKWISIQTSMVILFIMSFDQSDSYYGYEYNQLSTNFYNRLVIVLLFGAVFLSIIAWLYVRKGSNMRTYEFYGVIASIFLMVFSAYFYQLSFLLPILFNILIFAISLGLIYTGYQREEIKIVNLGIFWISILVIVRYFDFFWDMLDTSLFFLLGGVILILGAIFMERTRRKLKQKFNNSNIVNE